MFKINIDKQTAQMTGVIAVAILLLGSLYLYNEQKNIVPELMSNNTRRNESETNPTPFVSSSFPSGEQFSPVKSGGVKITENPVGVQKLVNDPSELLPKDANSKWANNPYGETNLNQAASQLLTAGHHVGVDTVGQSLRNANLQLRSEPPNPRNSNVGPWNASTIEPDTQRRNLEIGNN